MSDQQPQANNTQQPHDHQSKHEDEERKQPILESASATNSPDNHGGPGAYIVVGIVLALLVAIALALCNVVEAAVTTMDWEDYGSSYGHGYDDFFDEFDDLDEFDGLGSSGTSGQDLTPDNVFDVSFSCVESSIADYVFASDYSGSQAAVSAYVKALANQDASFAAEVKGHLRAAAAASDDDTRASELQAAADAAAQAYQAIEGIALPSQSDLTGSKAADIIDDLTSGRDDALARWNKIAQLVEMVQNPDGHTTRKLSDLDDEAADVTEPALELTHALSNSASHK